MRAHSAAIAYTPFTDQIEVGRFDDPDFVDRTRRLTRTCGAFFTEVRAETDFVRSKSQTLATFATIVLRDGIDAAVVARAFMAIAEFRDALPDDLLPPEHQPERWAQRVEPV